MGLIGVGKSELVECMYKFVVELFRFFKNVLFIVFNVVDYLENL